MRLTDLDPKVNGDTLHFWCPKCENTDHKHKVGCNATWGDISQPFETMTLQHSIRVVGGCAAHFEVHKGQIDMCAEGT